MAAEMIKEKVSVEKLTKLAEDYLGEMVKLAIDIEKGKVAAGGELHADGEALLLQDGSGQQDIWGANIYPNKSPEDRLEYTALINIRPAIGNPTMEIGDKQIKNKIKEIVGAFF